MVTDAQLLATQRRLQQQHGIKPDPPGLQRAQAADAMLGIVAARAERHADPENEYRDEEGLLCCVVCRRRKQTIVTPPFEGAKPRVVRCRCACLTEDELRQQAQERELEAQRRERRRRSCFARLDGDGKILDVSRAVGWTFANDKGLQPELTAAARIYAEQFREHLRDGTGLLYYGDVGTGKSFTAACIANAVIDQGYTARMTDFPTVRNELFAARDKQRYINDLCAPDLLVLDDLGVESKSDWMRETVFNVINTRVQSGKPMIITTNLTKAELARPAEIDYKRIYDRIPERCLSVHVAGESLRTGLGMANRKMMQEKLGMAQG